MKLVQNLWGDWQRLTCGHQWVRARWEDGTYGLRCARCMKAYRHTWEEIIAAPGSPAAPVSIRSGIRSGARTTEQPNLGLRRAA